MAEEFNDIKYYRCEICEYNERLCFFKESNDSEEIKTFCEECLDELRKTNNIIVLLNRLPISYGVYLDNWYKYDEIRKEELEKEWKKHFEKRIFKINKHITLKNEVGDRNYRITNIYIDGKLFKQCTYLLLVIPKEEIEEYDNIKSVDDITERLNHDLHGTNPYEFNITPEQ